MKTIAVLASSLFILMTMTNCSEPKFNFEQKQFPSDEDISKNYEEISRKCVGGVPTEQTFTFSFPNPNVTCPWNQNGNLGPRNGYFQGRIEQDKSFSLPLGSTLCDLNFSFPNQSFQFDDHFMLTLNHAVLASSYNYMPKFYLAGGLLRIYEWDKIAGIEWITSEEGVFCNGASEGKARCSWPATDTPGSISMDFDPSVIQKVFAVDPTLNTHTFSVISVGDNDDLDCEHSDITFTVRAHFIQ